MGPIASQITSVSIVYLTVSTGADQRKHQTSASLTFVRGIHRRPMISPHKWPVTRKMFPFDEIIMLTYWTIHWKPQYIKKACIVITSANNNSLQIGQREQLTLMAWHQSNSGASLNSLHSTYNIIFIHAFKVTSQNKYWISYLPILLQMSWFGQGNKPVLELMLTRLYDIILGDIRLK